MIEDLRRAAGRHLEGAGSEPGQPWGWKNPRSIYVLPLLDEVFTGMRFVHVVRDPRDMAFSGNRNQLTRHGVLYLRPDERDEPPAVQTAVLWQRVNNEARAYGSSMEGRYLLVRYEDLCLHPRRGASDLAAFLGIDTDPEGLDEAAGLVAVPPSIGRWRRQDPALVTRIGSLLDAELAAYGYDDEAWLHRVGELLPPL